MFLWQLARLTFDGCDIVIKSILEPEGYLLAERLGISQLGRVLVQRFEQHLVAASLVI